MKYWLILPVLLLATPIESFGALTCDTASQTQTFFDTMPRVLPAHNAIAKIEIVDTKVTDHARTSTVKVTKAFAGTKRGQKFTVRNSATDCSREVDVQPGHRFFISGNLDDKDIFRGEWQDADLDQIEDEDDADAVKTDDVKAAPKTDEKKTDVKTDVKTDAKVKTAPVKALDTKAKPAAKAAPKPTKTVAQPPKAALAPTTPAAKVAPLPSVQ